MTDVQRRLVVGLCLIVAVSFCVGASLTFMLTPMLDDLGLTTDQAGTALAIPSIASLLIVFAVGRLGDRLGHRRVIIASSVTFVAGALLVATATVMPVISIGLVFAGASSTAIQIVALGLLQGSIPEGRARVSAFTSYGMVFPAVYLAVPVLTGWLVGVASWRVVPIGWALLGLLIPILALRLIERPARPTAVGELWTPILAGVALAGAVQTINRIHDDGWASPLTWLSATVAVCALVVCWVLVRSSRPTSLSLTALRSRTMLLMLAGVALVAMANTLTYVMVGLEYLYGLTVLQAAVALVPAQAAAVVGAKVVAGRMMARWGTPRAGSVMLGGFAITMLSLVLVSATSPMWLLLVASSLFSLFGFGSITVVNAAVMASSPGGEAGMVSAYRGAASSLGTALSVVILGAAVTAVVTATSTSAAGELPDPAALANGLRADGLVGAAIAALAWVSFRLAVRRRGSGTVAQAA